MGEHAVFSKIREQQPKERSAVWMVGEQLKDMLQAEPEFCDIVLQDIETKGMSLADCEKQIKAYADKHKTGNFACVTPVEAEGIIREFYGMTGETDNVEKPGGNVIDLSAFW